MNNATPIGAGKSSFELIDSTQLFRELNLKPGMTILDLACGKGAYSLVASEKVGAGGSVYAVDLWEDGIAQLKNDKHWRLQLFDAVSFREVKRGGIFYLV
jgi:cyclopropane fatty-acyl-phospholipid synthase-like methyltransferase